MKTIVIADDHQIFRESLAELLDNHGFKTLWTAGNGVELLSLLETVTPDVVITDIGMPKMDGCEASVKAIKTHPLLNILVLSSFGEEKYYFQMLQAGVKGFVLKNAGMEELIEAINEIASGGMWFSRELMQKAIISLNKKASGTHVVSLTDRELDVLNLICTGQTAKDIARELGISIETVRSHRASLLSKTAKYMTKNGIY